MLLKRLNRNMGVMVEFEEQELRSLEVFDKATSGVEVKLLLRDFPDQQQFRIDETKQTDDRGSNLRLRSDGSGEVVFLHVVRASSSPQSERVAADESNTQTEQPSRPSTPFLTFPYANREENPMTEETYKVAHEREAMDNAIRKHFVSDEAMVEFLRAIHHDAVARPIGGSEESDQERKKRLDTANTNPTTLLVKDLVTVFNFRGKLGATGKIKNRPAPIELERTEAINVYYAIRFLTYLMETPPGRDVIQTATNYFPLVIQGEIRIMARGLLKGGHGLLSMLEASFK